MGSRKGTCRATRNGKKINVTGAPMTVSKSSAKWGKHAESPGL